MIFGLGIALLVALSESTKDIYFSSHQVKALSHLAKAFVLNLLSIPLVVIVVMLHGIAVIKPEFWWYVSIEAVLMALATYLYMRALALGPVSQTQPILALTTVFLVVTNPLMTHERVTIVGWIGVMLVAVGIYATQHSGIDPRTGRTASLWSPFIEMFRQEGVRSKLGVAVIYAITANLDRLALDSSDGPTYLLIVLPMIAAVLGIVMMVVYWSGGKGRGKFPLVDPQTWYTLAPGGVVNSITTLLHMWALTLTTVPYVIAVKRLSIVFVSLWGYVVRKERKPHWHRLVGVALVVSGVVIISLFG